MKKLKKAYKIEIKPTEEQMVKINKTIGVARFIYNFYIAHNKEIYEKEKRFVSGMDFSKWRNNEYIPKKQNMKWIKDVSSKSTKQSIMNADKPFRDFLKKLKDFRDLRKRKSRCKSIFSKE